HLKRHVALRPTEDELKSQYVIRKQRSIVAHVDLMLRKTEVAAREGPKQSGGECDQRALCGREGDVPGVILRLNSHAANGAVATSENQSVLEYPAAQEVVDPERLELPRYAHEDRFV